MKTKVKSVLGSDKKPSKQQKHVKKVESQQVIWPSQPGQPYSLMGGLNLYSDFGQTIPNQHQSEENRQLYKGPPMENPVFRRERMNNNGKPNQYHSDENAQLHKGPPQNQILSRRNMYYSDINQDKYHSDENAQLHNGPPQNQILSTRHMNYADMKRNKYDTDYQNPHLNLPTLYGYDMRYNKPRELDAGSD